MSTDVKVTYVNQSSDPSKPTIFVFSNNMTPTFDAAKDGIAWQAMPDIAKGGSHEFVYPTHTTLSVSTDENHVTAPIAVQPGLRYTVVLDEEKGLLIKKTGPASNPDAIEVTCQQCNGAINTHIFRDGKVLLSQPITPQHKVVSYVIKPKLHWGVASKIQDGQSICNAVLDTDHFYEQDLEGISDAIITLTGNAEDGYQFKVELAK